MARPDYKIIQKDASTGKWRRIGAGWISEKGGFNLSIGERGQEQRYLMLKDDYEEKRADPKLFQEAIKEAEKGGQSVPDFVDDAVPF